MIRSQGHLAPSLQGARPSLGLALIMLAAGLPACDAVTAKRTTEQIIPVAAGTAIQIRTQNGWIRVRRGRKGFVTLRTHRRVTALRDGQKQLDNLKVQVTKDKGILRIQGRHPKDPKQRRYQISFVVSVPPGSPLTLETNRGFLKVSDLAADITGRTGDGEIRIQDVTGALDLKTQAGNIRAVGAFPSLRLETGVGNVNVTLTPGARLRGDSTLLSRQGAVTLTLPPDVPATVTAESRRGGVSSDVPPQSKRPRWLRALVAGGGPAVSLLSHRGEVRLRTRR